VSFVVRCPLRDFLTIAHSGLKRRESELYFERTAHGEELLVIPSRRVNPKGLGMDLVDRDVDVLVIGIVVTHRDVLVLGKPQSIHEASHNPLKLLSFEAPIVGVK
jgi:hypothetical protein